MYLLYVVIIFFKTSTNNYSYTIEPNYFFIKKKLKQPHKILTKQIIMINLKCQVAGIILKEAKNFKIYNIK